MARHYLIIFFILFKFGILIGQTSNLEPFINPKGKMGFKDKETKQIIIPPKYQSAQIFFSGFAPVRRKNHWFFINEKGDKLGKHQFDKIQHFNEGLAAVCVNNLWGYIDTLGQIVIKPKYQKVAPFQKGYAIVSKEGKDGVINPNDSLLIPFQYVISPKPMGLLLTKGTQQGLWNKSKGMIIPLDHQILNFYGDGNILYSKKNQSYGIYYSKIEKDTGPIFNTFEIFNNQFYTLKKGKFYGLYDLNLKEILPPIYERIGDPFDPNQLRKRFTFIRIKKEGLLGFADEKGKIIISPLYDYVENLNHSSRIVVNKGNKFGIIDREGDLIIPAEFEDIRNYYSEQIQVKKEGKWGFYHKGKVNFDIQPDTLGIYELAEKMPRFKDCTNPKYPKKDLEKCANIALVKFIQKEAKYTPLAREIGIEGNAVVSFIIDQTGEIRNPKIERDPGAGLGQMALNVIQRMPKWIPGEHRGQKVNVRKHLIIRFRLKDLN